MLAAKSNGSGSPALLLLHFLGGSAREWQEIVAALGPRVRTIAIDLPGFGDSADIPGYTVSEMADALTDLIASLDLESYLLIGHSMSGKVAAVLASRNTLPGLAGLILIAPSPPAPEPMQPGKREQMVENLGTIREGDRERARSYVTKNEQRDIPPDVLDRATEDVQRMNRAAWTAWVERGSREDWADRVGSISLPTLLVVGEKDSSLGLEVQQSLTLPHFESATVKVIPECGHLIPMEKPLELAAHISEFLETLRDAPAVPKSYTDLIHSDRVSPRTRELLLARMEPRSHALTSLTDVQIQILRAVVDRVIPQLRNPIDIAGFIDERLASGHTDGWRYDELPPDREAYAHSLDTLDDMAHALHSAPFTELPVPEQDDILSQIAAAGPIQAPHLFRWFEDLRADAAAAWMAHPQTLARIGYSGIGIGGATTPHAGFVSLGPGAREPWEPAPSESEPAA